MEKRVREILSWYDSENPGTRTNIARLLNHGRLGGTGRLVILPVDQGFEHGPARSFAVNPGAYDPTYHFQLAIDAGCNAYAAPLGFLEAGVAEFAGDIPLILKMNNHDVLNDEKIRSGVTASVKTRLARLRGGGLHDLRARPAQAMYQQCREMMPVQIPWPGCGRLVVSARHAISSRASGH
jgi:class I fructose-bisphosphate aldolase